LRSTPAKIYGWEGEKDVEVRYLDPATGGLTAEPFDLVILSIGLGGPAQNGFLPGLGRSEDGFLSAEDEGRVFLAGSCREPKAISEAMSEGRRIALRLAMSLGTQE
jgi:heterodisulfide reductase subunit A-like polyferredoxin